MEYESHLKSLEKEIGFKLRSIPHGKFTFSTIGYSIRDEHLVGLNLYQSNLESIPKSVFLFENLEDLYLSYNSIKEIPKDIKGLKKLVNVNLGHNTIEIIPNEILSLKRLKYFDLSKNRINKINQVLTDLKIEIIYEKSILYTPRSGLNVVGNPITMPPVEVVKRGKESILDYYQLLDTGNVLELNEAKVLIVGEGGVGKSSFKKSLLGYPFNKEEKSTEGIDITAWKIQDSNNKKYKVNIWDFGGQEIYYSTHQFFLTKRSLYIFMWEARRDDDLIIFDYWLNVIKLLSDNAPVILVQNKIDERTKLIDQESITSKFSNIVGFYDISVKNDFGLDSLREKIKNEISNLYNTGDILPIKWTLVKKKLETLKDNFISFEEYLTICREFELSEKVATYLSRYLHDLGVFLHFEENLVLKEIIFLNPEWATSSVYSVIDSNSAKENFGELTITDFENIWKDYPRETHLDLLELMKKFELCLEIPNSNKYIIPELLASKKPEININFDSATIFEYQYDFMPAGVLSRLIVRTSDLNVDKIYWKNGLVLSYNSSNAYIEKDAFRRKISIKVIGDDSSDLLSIIRREIDFIHASMNNPELKELLVCQCNACKKSNNPFKFNYSYLQRIQKESNKEHVTCQNSLEDISVERLLKLRNVSKEDIYRQMSYKKRAQIVTVGLGALTLVISIITVFVGFEYFESSLFKILFTVIVSSIMLYSLIIKTK